MNFLKRPIAELSSIGPFRASLLATHLDLHTWGDLLAFYPYRYEDRSEIYPIIALRSKKHPVQTRGVLSAIRCVVMKKKKVLVANLEDSTGKLQLVWFNRIEWVRRQLKEKGSYIVFGQPRLHQSFLSISHPEMLDTSTLGYKGIVPLYSTTQKLISGGIESRTIAGMQKELIEQVAPHIKETVPLHLLKNYDLMGRKEALRYIHFAPDKRSLAKARHRLKFEELLYLQLHLLQRKEERATLSKGEIFTDSVLLKRYYDKFLPFSLTSEQKRAVKEICGDMKKGRQMNRLLQGDVGSGKTIVAFLSMLLPIAGGRQVVFLAPTEVLAMQHYHKLASATKDLGLSTALLTGSLSKKERIPILRDLASGTIQILIGTHALLGDGVVFKKLGMAIIDEQHRFGVAQRAKLWQKNKEALPPHILVMTATPIPRTLAKALYGDLDISIIEGKPVGRKAILTSHYYDRNRLVIFARIREEVARGHQVYIVYPRIVSSSGEEVFKDLMDGHESICRAFPEVAIGILYGKMKSTDKAYEMARFVKGETKIMVGTTILEVGIDVPNATMIVIENAESFGLAQLHQLRGRVGRDVTQSYCLLLTRDKLSSQAKHRIKTMVTTGDGFKLAEEDLRLRGPGDLLGVQQSGLYKLRLADLTRDNALLEKAYKMAKEILDVDLHLTQPSYRPLKEALDMLTGDIKWSVIS